MKSVYQICNEIYMETLKHERKKCDHFRSRISSTAKKYNQSNVIISSVSELDHMKASIGSIYRSNQPEGLQLRRLSGARLEECVFEFWLT